jgi:hypothetical protein
MKVRESRHILALSGPLMTVGILARATSASVVSIGAPLAMPSATNLSAAGISDWAQYGPDQHSTVNSYNETYSAGTYSHDSTSGYNDPSVVGNGATLYSYGGNANGFTFTGTNGAAPNTTSAASGANMFVYGFTRNETGGVIFSVALPSNFSGTVNAFEYDYNGESAGPYSALPLSVSAALTDTTNASVQTAGDPLSDNMHDAAIFPIFVSYSGTGQTLTVTIAEDGSGSTNNTYSNVGVMASDVVPSPEPASLALLSLGGMALLTRQRRTRL